MQSLPQRHWRECVANRGECVANRGECVAWVEVWHRVGVWHRVEG